MYGYLWNKNINEKRGEDSVNNKNGRCRREHLPNSKHVISCIELGRCFQTGPIGKKKKKRKEKRGPVSQHHLRVLMWAKNQKKKQNGISYSYLLHEYLSHASFLHERAWAYDEFLLVGFRRGKWKRDQMVILGENDHSEGGWRSRIPRLIRLQPVVARETRLEFSFQPRGSRYSCLQS